MARADKKNVTLWLALLLMQDTGNQADRARAAMESSLAQQRASVQRQAQAAGASMTAVDVRRRLRAGRGTVHHVPAAVRSDRAAGIIGHDRQRGGQERRRVLGGTRSGSPGVGFPAVRRVAKGGQGLMQLMPATQDQFNVTDPFNPMTSLDAGTKLLKQLLERYHGDLSLALSAYNAGAATVDKAGGIPQIPETQDTCRIS